MFKGTLYSDQGFVDALDLFRKAIKISDRRQKKIPDHFLDFIDRLQSDNDR